MSTVKCLNDGCKFNCNGKCSEKKIELNYKGTCNNFSPNFTYYFTLGLETMKSSIVFEHTLTFEQRLGLYYVMEVYGLTLIDFRGCLFISEKDSNKSITLNDLDENRFKSRKRR